jgi:hypothetical protein
MTHRIVNAILAIATICASADVSSCTTASIPQNDAGARSTATGISQEAGNLLGSPVANAANEYPLKGRTYTSLDEAWGATTFWEMPYTYPMDARLHLSACLAKAAVMDIPSADRFVMLESFNKRSVSPDADSLFLKWVGISFLQGSAAAPQFSASRRVTLNAERICPLLVTHYPEAFQP